jgi:excisionase family DNA binding protein
METSPLLLTPAEVAVKLGIGRTKVYALINDGSLTSVKIGASRRIHVEVVNAFAHSLADAS